MPLPYGEWGGTRIVEKETRDTHVDSELCITSEVLRGVICPEAHKNGFKTKQKKINWGPKSPQILELFIKLEHMELHLRKVGLTRARRLTEERTYPQGCVNSQQTLQLIEKRDKAHLTNFALIDEFGERSGT
jgi:hypothetical protein